ncbi:hypothetical protein JX266_008553 [Neoarthrinium moseri]|nr:hypothetical protein JX266_008553 [Neoarthrinium moseri]
MATRRSARLQELPALDVAHDKQDAPGQAAAVRKPKLQTPAAKPTPKRARSLGGVVKGKTKTAADATTSKGKAQFLNPQINSVDVNAKILSLPLEVLSIILDNIEDPPTLSALGRTSKMCYSVTMPRLYNRIAVAAMFHAHIPKLIRTLEPHLTIAQKKQLKKEGKYKGQQERYPTGLNEKEMPMCASFVRQMVVGAANPGKKHQYIVDRYIEEALKNMENLEILETWVMNKSISQTIASLQSLKALYLYAERVGEEDISSLAHIKNLKHLVVRDHGWSSIFVGHKLNVVQSMLRNSMSTLQSLTLHTNSSYGNPFGDWDKTLRTSTGANATRKDDEAHNFAALKSLSLSGTLIDEDFMREFAKAIDVLRLRELTLAYLNDQECLFYPFLASLATSYRGTTDVPISLRTLNLRMSDDHLSFNNEQLGAYFDAKCHFISSFDTLTMLELLVYGEYPSGLGLANPGLSETLLQAILKHENLRVLRFSYSGWRSEYNIPSLGPKTVGRIIDGLPRLRELEFVPTVEQMGEISQALLRGGGHLESVTYFPARWDSGPRPDEPSEPLSSILRAFLSNPKIDLISQPRNKEFVWEDHYKLNRVSDTYQVWEVASKFEKPRNRKGNGKGRTKPGKIQVEVAGGMREVWYRLVPRTQHIHVGYDPDFKWVKMAEKELR